MVPAKEKPKKEVPAAPPELHRAIKAANKLNEEVKRWVAPATEKQVKK